MIGFWRLLYNPSEEADNEIYWKEKAKD